MEMCSGDRHHPHSEVVYEGGECPVCEMTEEKREAEKRAEEAEVECEALKEQVEEAKAELESYQSDLRAAVRGAREAQEVVDEGG
mgnify:CR=1 FL=1